MKTLKSFIAIFSIIVSVAIAASSQTSLTSLDGAKVDIQRQDGKVVILSFGASWLPLSAKQADYTNALARKYAGKNVVVYFVSVDSTNPKSKNFATNDDIQKFVIANKLSVPVLRDSDGTATLKKFNIDQVPSFVILDKQGNRAGELFGGIDPKFDITVPISKAVDGLL